MNISITARARCACLASVALLSIAACGGGSSGSSSAGMNVDFLVQDGPSDELLSFTAVIEKLRLTSANGATANLLGNEVSVEFLGLQSVKAWLVRARPSAGTYSGIEMVFDPASVVAVDKSGTPVAVTVSSSTLTASFTTPLHVGAAGYGRVVVDLDLSLSLSGSVSAPPLDFDAQGSAWCDDGDSSMDIDEIEGIVQSSDFAAQQLVLLSSDDDDGDDDDGDDDGDNNDNGGDNDDDDGPLGPVTVLVQPSTLLLDEDGQELSNAAFFAALVDDATELEVQGMLADGSVLATRIEIEGQEDEDDQEVEIEGLVASLGPGQQFELLIAEIEEGASIAGPVLASLGDPSSIPVTYDALTEFVFDDSDDLTDAGSLAVGMRVEVEFPSFVSSPFYASEVELDDDTEFEGLISDDSGLPSSIVLHLNPTEPVIRTGQVAAPDTDITVDLTSASVHLDTRSKPGLQSGQLLAGMKVEVRGSISGSATAPTIAATGLVVHAGRFEGTVLWASQSQGRLLALIDELKEPFGNTLTTAPFEVVIAPGCMFDDEASAFFELFDALGSGETLRIRVAGIGSGTPDEIDAYEIEVGVED